MRSVSGSPDVIIVGGGVAGLAAARVLASRKLRVALFESAPRLASQASGNNAAIFRPLEDDVASAELPRRSRQLLEAWFGTAPLEPTGLVLVSESASTVARLASVAERARVAHEVLASRALYELAPSLAGGEAQHALLLREGGVLDVPALTGGLAAQARAFGADLQTGVCVRALVRVGDRIDGVLLEDATRISAAHVIVAAGAWNASLGESAGVAVPLLPLRRHLVELDAATQLTSDEPVAWRLEDEVYYRKHGSGVLASPCDESLVTSSATIELATDPSAIGALQPKLQRFAPALAGGAIKRAWACLRTFARDRELVVGPDPRVRGLYWFGGLGGRGMSVALAASEWLASSVSGTPLPPEAAALLPARLLGPESPADRTA